jgi:hypothetical protein
MSELKTQRKTPPTAICPSCGKLSDSVARCSGGSCGELRCGFCIDDHYCGPAGVCWNQLLAGLSDPEHRSVIQEQVADNSLEAVVVDVLIAAMDGKEPDFQKWVAKLGRK